MALQMARPYKHPKTGVYYFRQHVPTDLRCLLGDKIVSRSLRTKDPDAAKLANAQETQKQAVIWERYRKKPEPIPHAQIVALSGIIYRDFMAMLEMEPGEPDIWVGVFKLLDRVAATPDGLEKFYGNDADKLFLERGIVTDDHSRRRLLEEIDRAMRQAAEQQQKRANGDYSPDPKANRFPSLRIGESSIPPETLAGPSITALFKLWERDHLAAGKPARTVGDFRQKIDALKEWLGHDDAKKVTPENMADWCEHLRHEQKLQARTVSQKYLAVAKLVFKLAVEKRKLKSNPAEGTVVRFTKPKRTRSPGYTDAEAKMILHAALTSTEGIEKWSEESRRAVRWGPWVCAFTGARIAEIMQMRTEDLLIEVIDGKAVPCLRVTPEAGSVKTGNFRIVPLHPQLLEIGFVEMISKLPAGPVFFNPLTSRKDVDTVLRARNAGARVWRWVREIVKITDARLQPNHAWRHRFKTLARDHDIAAEYTDAIQGHEDGRAASDYGETTLRVLWREVQKLPRVDIEFQPSKLGCTEC